MIIKDYYKVGVDIAEGFALGLLGEEEYYHRLEIEFLGLMSTSKYADREKYLYELLKARKAKTMPMKYTINNNSTILFWGNESKTEVKRKKEDENNPQLAFLIAFFQKHSGLSKTQANKYLENLDCKDKESVILFEKISKAFKESAQKAIKNMFVNEKNNDKDIH